MKIKKLTIYKTNKNYEKICNFLDSNKEIRVNSPYYLHLLNEWVCGEFEKNLEICSISTGFDKLDFITLRKIFNSIGLSFTITIEIDF